MLQGKKRNGSGAKEDELDRIPNMPVRNGTAADDDSSPNSSFNTPARADKGVGRGRSSSMLNPSSINEFNGQFAVVGRSSQADSSRKSSSKRKPRGTRSMSVSVISASSEIRYTGYVTGDAQHSNNRRHQRAVGVGASTPQRNEELRGRLKDLQSSSQLSGSELQMLQGVLRSHFLFSRMPTSCLTQICWGMERMTLSIGEPVVEQGQMDAEHFYIVNDGEFQVEVTKAESDGPIPVAKLSTGAAFGEMALLYATTRTATVRCTVPGSCFSLSRAMYLLIIQEGEEEGDQRRATDNSAPSSAIESAVPWLFSLTDANLERKTLLKSMQEVAMRAGETSFGQSSPVGPCIIVLMSGTITFTGDPSKASRDEGLWRVSSFGDSCADTTLDAGDVIIIGSAGDEGIMSILYNNQMGKEVAMLATKESDMDEAQCKLELKKKFKLRLLGGSSHLCTLKANDDCCLMMLPLQEFMTHLPEWSDDLLDSTDAVRCMLLNTPFGSRATSKEVDAMAFAFKPEVVDPGTEFTTAGVEATHATLVLSGIVTIERGDGVFVCEAGPGDVIGELSLAECVPSLTTCRAADACVVLQLPREAYRSMNLSQLVDRASAEGLGRLYAQLDDPRVAGASEAKLDDFQTMSVIGAGAFAQVALVQHTSTSALYVLKKMNRNHLVKSKMQKQILRERSALGYSHHPNIAMLYGTFSSHHSLYMLCEPCTGGELYAYMREVNTLEEKPAAFYAACVIAAVEYMHSRDIMYRDLKPENLVIAANGYVKVVDFGFAKRTRSRTYTLCGTPEYLAPELILMKGHSFTVDWWAVGVLLYEMLLGGAPFIWLDHEPFYNLSPSELYKNILNPNFDFHMPPTLSADVVDLMRRLLAWHPLRRLGCLTSRAADVKNHAFFTKACQLDWRALHDCTIPPPKVPTLSGPDDVSNFEEAYEDPQFLSEAPYQPPPGAWDATF